MIKPDAKRYARAIECLEAVRGRTPGTLSYNDGELALMLIGDLHQNLLDSLEEMTQLVVAMSESKLVPFTDAQRTAMKERYGRARFAIAISKGEQS